MTWVPLWGRVKFHCHVGDVHVPHGREGGYYKKYSVELVVTCRQGLQAGDHEPVHTPEVKEHRGSRDALDDWRITGEHCFLRCDCEGRHVMNIEGGSGLISRLSKLY